MEKVLNQQEIDDMVRAARGVAAAGSAQAAHRHVTPWDARTAGQIGRDQMRSISALHEGFARSLTHSLGAYLRTAFTAALVSAEHLSYRDFLQTLPEVTYLASCKLAPVGAIALLQLDLPVAFPLLDLLLGGEGKGEPPARAISEIEEQILETVVQVICRELQTAWQVLSLEFQFDQRQQPEKAQHLMPLDEKTLALSFEITLPDSRGTLNLAVPAVVSNALLRKLATEWARSKPRGQPGSNQRLRDRLLSCFFQVELGLTSVAVSMRQLVSLAPGGLLILRRATDKPATLMVGGLEMFHAAVARRGPLRAAQVLGRCPERALERKPKR
jgi:flagellar motor switch protein FliM